MSERIHHIFYINLKRRYDRRVEIETELNQMKLPYERFNAIENVHGFIGCSHSHLAVLKLAKERGYPNVLILEDDFTFLISKEDFERRLNTFLDRVPNYDVFMLSYNLRESQDIPASEPDTDTDFVLKRVLYAQTASGYLVSSSYYDKLIELYEWAFPLLEQTHQHWNYMNDVVWKTLQEKDGWYCMEPRIGKQRESYSDLGGSVVNYGV
jgi:GR25 family glycosyltransferase involved in LPS biosynthesis